MPSGDSMLLFAVALLNCITAILGWMTYRQSLQTEKNTNSIVEKLMTKTDEAASARGREEMRVEVVTKAEKELRAEDGPVPVKDAEAAVIATRTAVATEAGTKAQERIADAAEKKGD